MYLVISTGPDGIHIEQKSRKDLEDELTEEGLEDVITKMPAMTDPMYWGTVKLIIEGKIVTPQVVEKITKITL